VDYKNSPTKNFNIQFSVIGKLNALSRLITKHTVYIEKDREIAEKLRRLAEARLECRAGVEPWPMLERYTH
jgi:hypothetical protein